MSIMNQQQLSRHAWLIDDEGDPIMFRRYDPREDVIYEGIVEVHPGGKMVHKVIDQRPITVRDDVPEVPSAASAELAREERASTAVEAEADAARRDREAEEAKLREAAASRPTTRARAKAKS